MIANLAALEKMGWKADDVQITFLAPSDAELACSQGSVDAWSTWEPYVGQEEVLFKSRRVITAEGLTPGPGFQVATAISIRDKRLELTALHPPARGCKGLVAQQHPQLCRDVGQVDEYPGRGPAALARARCAVRIAHIDDSVTRDEQSTIDLYFRWGLIKRKLDAEDLVDRSFSDAIAKGL